MINYNLSTSSAIEQMNNVITVIDFEAIINKTLESEEDENFHLFVNLPKNYYALFLLVIPLLTISGNGLVIASVLKNRSLQTATNFLILNLAVADFIVALCVMPFAVYVEVENSYWRLPKDLCHMYMAMDVCASTASILNLVAISWDRYIAVSRPMLYARKARKLRGVVGVIIGIWIVSIFIAVPMITGLNKLEETEHCEFTNATYIVASSVGSFFVPCLAILILYTVVLKTLQTRQRLRRSQMKKTSSNTTTECSFDGKTFAECPLGTPTVSDEKEVTVYTGLSKSPHHETNGSVRGDATVHLSSAMKEMQVPSPFKFSDTSDLSSPPASIDLWLKRMSEENGTVPFVDDVIMNPLIEDEENSPPRLRVVSAPLAQMESVDNIRASFREKISVSLPMSEISPRSMGRNPRKSPINNRYYEKNRYRNCDSSPSNRQRLRKLNSVVSFSHPLPSASTSPRPRTEQSSKADYSPPVSSSETSRTDKKSSSQLFFNNAAATAIKNNANHILNKLTKKQRLKESRHFYKEKRATHTLAVVLVVFLLCWVPFFTCHMSNSICMLQFDRPCVPFLAFFLTTWLGYMNSFMNPVIYTVFNAEYRKAFVDILFSSSKNVRRIRTSSRSEIRR